MFKCIFTDNSCYLEAWFGNLNELDRLILNKITYGVLVETSGFLVEVKFWWLLWIFLENQIWISSQRFFSWSLDVFFFGQYILVR